MRPSDDVISYTANLPNHYEQSIFPLAQYSGGLSNYGSFPSDATWSADSFGYFRGRWIGMRLAHSYQSGVYTNVDSVSIPISLSFQIKNAIPDNSKIASFCSTLLTFTEDTRAFPIYEFLLGSTRFGV